MQKMDNKPIIIGKIYDKEFFKENTVKLKELEDKNFRKDLMARNRRIGTNTVKTKCRHELSEQREGKKRYQLIKEKI